MKKFVKNLEELMRVVKVASGFLLVGSMIITTAGVATDNQTMTDVGYGSFVLGASGRIAIIPEESYYPGDIEYNSK